MDYLEESLKLHYQWKGKIESKCRVQVTDRQSLSLAYTPGVAQPCLEIQKDPAKSYQLTRRWNTVAVITDGSAILGLGDIGPEAGMPVMEGKCALYKNFADIDAVPLCIRSKSVDDIVKTISLLCGSFGAIHLEDIAAPRCFEIKEQLRKICDIPIYHDDQDSTSIICLAGLINACKLTGKKFCDLKIVISGAGAGGMATANLLLDAGVKNIIVNDSCGLIYKGRSCNMNPYKQQLAEKTNLTGLKGGLAGALKGADVFIGLSAPKLVTKEMVASMAPKSVVFSCANPYPEIFPEDAKQAGAYIVASGRSDYPNQINNILVYPGLMRGVLDGNIKDIDSASIIRTARALADMVSEKDLNPENILPNVFQKGLVPVISRAVRGLEL